MRRHVIPAIRRCAPQHAAACHSGDPTLRTATCGMSFRRSRDHDAKQRLVVLAGIHIDGTAMCLDDLINDVKPKSQPLAASGGTQSAPERIEQVI
jgi:hypothetical protein